MLAANPDCGRRALCSPTSTAWSSPPIRRTAGPRAARALLGGAEPLTILADKAGALRVQGADGDDEFAAVRNLRAAPGQVAFVSPIDDLFGPGGGRR